LIDTLRQPWVVLGAPTPSTGVVRAARPLGPSCGRVGCLESIRCDTSSSALSLRTVEIHWHQASPMLRKARRCFVWPARSRASVGEPW
jgi:hypothetical protein